MAFATTETVGNNGRGLLNKKERRKELLCCCAAALEISETEEELEYLRVVVTDMFFVSFHSHLLAPETQLDGPSQCHRAEPQ